MSRACRPRSVGVLRYVTLFGLSFFVVAERDSHHTVQDVHHVAKPEPVATQSAAVAETDETDSGVCNPSLPIFHMVMKFNEKHFIRSGPPQPPSTPITDLSPLRSCERWSTGSCCTDQFFEQVGKIWNGEAKRFQMIRDYYQFVISDSVQPAIAALEAKNEVKAAEKATEVKDLLEKSPARVAVQEYVDKCEDNIRLFFGATLCELCDPHLDAKLTEDRVLRVHDDSCTALHDSCKDMPARLSAAADLFNDAAGRMSAATAGLPVDHGEQQVVQAVTTLKKAGVVIGNAAAKIAFYQDRQKLCDNLETEGFAYRPVAWADLDQLHPGSLKALTPPQSEQGQETFGDSTMAVLKEKLHAIEAEEAQSGLNTIPLPPPQKYGVLPPTTCEHGKLEKTEHGSACSCLPCWTGNKCEVPIRNRATQKQRFRPMTSEPQAQPQSIAIMGCGMFDAAQPLQSMMAHIKFVRSGPLSDEEKTRLKTAGQASTDVCLVRASAPGFGSLLSQVPISTFESNLEYLVHVPELIETTAKRYTVCFCYGPECLEELEELSGAVVNHKFQEKDALSWYSAGHVNVHRAENTNSVQFGNAANGYWYAPHVAQSVRPCGEQWAFGDLANAGIGAQKVQGDMVSFSCAKDFIDLLGPRWLRCIDGTWFQEPEQDQDPAETLKVWNQHLPYCRWKFTSCTPPTAQLEGGSVTVMGGMSRYACVADRRLVFEGRPVQASSFVRWCTESGDWRPRQVPVCELVEGKVEAMPSSVKVQTSATPSGLIQMSSKEEMEDDQEPSAKVVPETKRSAPAASSFIALGVSSQQKLHSTGHATQHSSHGAQREGVETSRRASAKVRANSKASSSSMAGSSATATGVARGILRIHSWKIKFTKDSTNRFSLDKCWITRSCSNGTIPDDAAASPLYAYSPRLEESRTLWSRSVVFAAAASIIFSLAAMAAVTKASKADSSAESPSC